MNVLVERSALGVASHAAREGGGVLPETLGGGGGVRPTSQKPYSIYGQNLRFLLPYLWPGQKFDSLFMTVAADTVVPNISYEGLLLIVDGLINNDEKKVASSKKHTQLKTNRYPIYDQNDWKTLPFAPHVPIKPIFGSTPSTPPPRPWAMQTLRTARHAYPLHSRLLKGPIISVCWRFANVGTAKCLTCI